MTIHRTVMASCNGPLCSQTVSLDPQGTQPYVRLAELGWTHQNTRDEILTFCPTHSKEKSDARPQP